ncbi:MAG: NAD(P)/FAD-dependent oxidoreductase [Bacteroidota bacterium]
MNAEQSHTDILILGAGLCGLVTAYYLRQSGLSIRILEARTRPGGRIHTIQTENATRIEMGATWLGQKHRHLNTLLQELELGIEPQFLGAHAIFEPISTSPPQLVDLPPNEDPSFRIKGGSIRLIESLLASLDHVTINYQQRVSELVYSEKGWKVKTDQDRFRSDLIISTLPPKLLVSNIDFSPSLPSALLDVAQQTHTWMGESIKVGLSFPEAFWRKGKNSGTIASNVGPITEMYDHTSEDGFALKGFMNGAFHATSLPERRKLALDQLEKYYGSQAIHAASYHECVWREEPFTFVPYDAPILPHQFNGEAIFREPLYQNSFYLSGSETAISFPGYMDGAVERGLEVAQQIMRST